MVQENDRVRITTVVYCTGTSPADRKDSLRTCLAHAANHCGEDWLTKPDFRKNVANAADIIETQDEEKIELKEADYREPIQRLYLFKGSPDRLVNGGTNNQDRRFDIIVTDPDVLSDRTNGFGRIQTLLNASNHVHLANTGLTLTPGTDISGATRRALMTISDAVHPAHDEDTDSSYAWTGGRPPTGFEVAEDGQRLVESENHEFVALTLQQVVDQKTSKRFAARKLGCARATITNAIENRPKMYGLDV